MDLMVRPKLSVLLDGQNSTELAISIIIPTRNEGENIEALLARISKAIGGVFAEVVFVDDSTDNTPEVIKSLKDQFPLQVTLVARPPERRGNGLGGAVIEGFRIAQAPWVCVMDADLQHPPELIPKILRHAQEEGVDLVVGSRLAPGGSTEGLTLKRALISHAFAIVTRITFPRQLKSVTDPLSGFFIVRRAAVDLECLRPDGFKILLEMIVRNSHLRVSEIPIHFGHRHAGESKASIHEVMRFFRLLLHLRLAGEKPFIRFLAVGASELVVNTVVLAAFTELTGLHFLLSAVIATQASTLWNFVLTEKWVFGKRTTEHSFSQRLAHYLVMNNLLLALRGPFLSLLVTQLGIHYLISNLLSLFAITLLRYFAADSWIWSKKRSSERKPDPMSTYQLE
jgi:dolichol-phosphate mannosyltransferase